MNSLNWWNFFITQKWWFSSELNLQWVGKIILGWIGQWIKGRLFPQGQGPIQTSRYLLQVPNSKLIWIESRYINCLEPSLLSLTKLVVVLHTCWHPSFNMMKLFSLLIHFSDSNRVDIWRLFVTHSMHRRFQHFRLISILFLLRFYRGYLNHLIHTGFVLKYSLSFTQFESDWWFLY